MNTKLTRDYAIQYAAKAFDLTSTQQSLLISLLHFRSMSNDNKCNPSRERLSIASGIKKLDDVTKHSKILEEKHILERKIYIEEGQRNKRVQYNFNDDLILERCKQIECEWYAQWKDDEDDSQVLIIANPEQHTEQEVEQAIAPAPKPVPEGKVKNPITGRIESYKPPVIKPNASYDANNLMAMLNDTRSLEQIKVQSENEVWRKQRESTIRYQQQNRQEDPFAPF